LSYKLDDVTLGNLGKEQTEKPRLKQIPQWGVESKINVLGSYLQVTTPGLCPTAGFMPWYFAAMSTLGVFKVGDISMRSFVKMRLGIKLFLEPSYLKSRISALQHCFLFIPPLTQFPMS
jgi:hypothetical protein